MSEKIKKGKKTRYDPDITPKLAESYAMEATATIK